MSLTGRTVFITGASRGIGKEIALRCAKEKANIVIAAKTTQEHPKLPGTIYTVAKEVEAAGGQCLPCVMDIRDADNVKSAIDETVDKFGGIDTLINNAGAIHTVRTTDTSVKKFDLMTQINLRGPFLTAKYAVPHLKKSPNPHILNVSPPLNLNPDWFKNHGAYTITKYGMSMAVLGMAEEFRADGIAVNALWPRYGVWTVAMAMLAGNNEVARNLCRKPEIMADAACTIITKDSRSFTGNFCIDDDVLRENGVSEADIEAYKYQADADLLPDFFLEQANSDKLYHMMMSADSAALRAEGASDTSKAGSGPAKIFQTISNLITPEHVNSFGGVFSFKLSGADEGLWFLDLKEGSGSVGQGEPPSGEADCTMSMDSADFVALFEGKLKATQAFMGGKLKIQGDLGLAMKLEKIMNQINKK